MGHKVHPKSFRLGVHETWQSKWFSKHDFSRFLRQDIEIRKYLQKKLKEAGLAQVEIERSQNNIVVNIFTSKPGVVIGRSGAGVDILRKELKDKVLRKPGFDLRLNIQEVTQPDLNAQIVCNNIILQIEKRIPFRRVMKQTIAQVMRAGAQGVKVMVSGRLDGVEIARTENLSQGKIPLHTIRSNIDYARGAAHTTYGAVGAKIWIYKGEVFSKKSKKEK
jgi:small subunit ribosomal protein S3